MFVLLTVGTFAHAAETDFSSFTTEAVKASLKLPLVYIETQSYPGEQYTMGFSLGESRNLLGLYYFDPTKPVEEQQKAIPLGNNPSIIFSKKGYDIARVTYQAPIMNIEFQQDARKGIWTSKKFEVNCDSHYHNCTVKDLEENKITNSLYIYNHRARVGGMIPMVVGIDSIESR